MTSAFHTDMCSQILAVLHPIQFLADGLGKVEDGPSAWVPDTMWETWMKLLVPRFRLDTVLAIAVI